MKKTSVLLLGIMFLSVSAAMNSAEASLRQLSAFEIGAVKMYGGLANNLLIWTKEFVSLADQNMKSAKSAQTKTIMLGKLNEMNSMLKLIKKESFSNDYIMERAEIGRLVRVGDLKAARDYVKAIQIELDRQI